MLAPASGAFIPEPDIELLKAMKAGMRIARIVDIFGNDLAEINAPADGMLFGLRALTNVTTGDWCCFFNKVQSRRD
jgi:predicted deacylase